MLLLRRCVKERNSVTVIKTHLTYIFKKTQCVSESDWLHENHINFLYKILVFINYGADNIYTICTQLTSCMMFELLHHHWKYTN